MEPERSICAYLGTVSLALSVLFGCGQESERAEKWSLEESDLWNEGFDYHCQCDEPSTDAGRRTEE